MTKKEREELIEARKQEMESILPNHFTKFMGEVIPSKKIMVKGGKK